MTMCLNITYQTHSGSKCGFKQCGICMQKHIFPPTCRIRVSFHLTVKNVIQQDKVGDMVQKKKQYSNLNVTGLSTWGICRQWKTLSLTQWARIEIRLTFFAVEAHAHQRKIMHDWWNACKIIFKHTTLSWQKAVLTWSYRRHFSTPDEITLWF